MRLAALGDGSRPLTRPAVESALLAHLCRCTGWQSIVEAGCAALGIQRPRPRPPPDTPERPRRGPGRVRSAARAVAGPARGVGVSSSGRDVVLGGGGFADDWAPPARWCSWVRRSRRRRARASPRRGGRRPRCRDATAPCRLVASGGRSRGAWALTLQTTWVEPAYVEPDASWCHPGGDPRRPLANGGAFGGKRQQPRPRPRPRPWRDRAAEPGPRCSGAVRTSSATGRSGPRWPSGSEPTVRAWCGSGARRARRMPGRPARAREGGGARAGDRGGRGRRAARWRPDLRGAGWVEVLAARRLHARRCRRRVGGRAHEGDGGRRARRARRAMRARRVDVTVPDGGRAARQPADPGWRALRAGHRPSPRSGRRESSTQVTLRSYVLGAVHQGLGLVWSEGSRWTPPGPARPDHPFLRHSGRPGTCPRSTSSSTQKTAGRSTAPTPSLPPTVAAAWIAEGTPPRWPTRRGAPVDVDGLARIGRRCGNR